MERSERAAFLFCAFGAGIAMLGVGIPFAFPEVSKVIWQTVTGIGAAVAVSAFAALIWNYKPKAHSNRMIPYFGMVVFGCGFLACLIWFLWPSRASDVAAHPAQVSPPIGSLQFKIAILEVGLSRSLNQAAAQIKIEIFNNTDKTIFFHAVTAGQINGIAFDQNKVEFDGYISPRDSNYLLSRRITEIPLGQNQTLIHPAFDGLYEYSLHYRYIDETFFSRLTAKTISIMCYNPLAKEPVGTITAYETTVNTYAEKEE